MRFLWPEVLSLPRPFLGLGRWRIGSPRTIGTVTAIDQAHGTMTITAAPPWPAAPWGWRWMKEEYRNSAICLPLWLYWPVYAWRYRWNLVCDPLIRLGLWCVNEEGGYYWDGRPTFPAWLRRAWWCFLHDRDESPEPCWKCGRISLVGECRYRLWRCGQCIDRANDRRVAAYAARANLQQRSA